MNAPYLNQPKLSLRDTIYNLLYPHKNDLFSQIPKCEIFLVLCMSKSITHQLSNTGTTFATKSEYNSAFRNKQWAQMMRNKRVQNREANGFKVKRVYNKNLKEIQGRKKKSQKKKSGKQKSLNKKEKTQVINISNKKKSKKIKFNNLIVNISIV